MRNSSKTCSRQAQLGGRSQIKLIVKVTRGNRCRQATAELTISPVHNPTNQISDITQSNLVNQVFAPAQPVLYIMPLCRSNKLLLMENFTILLLLYSITVLQRHRVTLSRHSPVATNQLCSLNLCFSLITSTNLNKSKTTLLTSICRMDQTFKKPARINFRIPNL